MSFLIISSIIFVVVSGNSESEKWSWPTAVKDRTKADSRKDIYYENVNDNERTGRIRVPTSYYDNKRPLQSYQVKEGTTNRPKPLSDEFSNESSGENYGNNINGAFNNNRYPQANIPNRFGPQQSNDFAPQFGQGAYPGGGGFAGGPAQFPGQFQGGLGPQQYPYQGGSFPIGAGGYPPTHSIANGILVGPGGPTGIIGRPYNQGQYGGGYPGGGFHQGFAGGFPGAFGYGPQGGFDGYNNGLGPQYGGYNPQFGGGFGQGPLFDQNSNKNLQIKKVEKSVK